ncbi:lytic transglycosylase domain-containing protein [Arcobacter caeni]|uniref:Lytic murein transglycosylase n=1 Tax=Arcobacter caeni TaxID=1912877 RepID=A0A363CYK9_9BACT|nr:lytic transglycosylase domain-containing protein [Arcobacter caeni]PUE64073.1 lytic murein transglycosylase [Arcobacter caeni]
MKKLVFSIYLIFLFNISVSASTNTTDMFKKDFKVTIEWLEQKPKSTAKDFFILQYLEQDDTSIEDAKVAYDMANESNSNVKKAYNKKFKTLPPEELRCYRATIEQLKKEDSKCIALGLSLNEATEISKNDLHFFITKLDAYPTLKKDLQIIASDNPFNSLINSDMDRFSRLFFDLNKEYRNKFFNKSLNQELINKIIKSKNFERFLRYVIYDKSLVNLQKSLLSVENNPQMNSENLFSLGINAVNNDNLNVALKFFNEANQKTYLRTSKDKCLFWIYLLTQNQLYLEELALSWDNNIYSLYAKELLNLEIDNIEYSIPLKNTKSSFNIYDPFEWMKVLDDTKKNFDESKLQKYEDLFSDENTLAHHAFVLERFNKYKKQYFITPYRNIVKNYDVDKQVLIYSIARQESHFIPSSISFSSAQGVMQIMPFLSSDIAKKLNEDYNIYEQFIPSMNIRYGSFHLDDLVKQFNNNPLFIAYAYNGGAGYTRSQLKKGLFKTRAKYEPFLSMELISFAETREYGKKVLANYYIYNNYLNNENKIDFSTIFQSLIELN